MSSSTDLLSRRAILAGIAATAALPAWAQTVTANPDVVIIGAGSAGLSAARTLIAKGKTVVIVEAANRIGGRAYTEKETFDVPFDHGCSWVTGPADLPYDRMAADWGFTLLDHSGASEVFYVGDQRASAQERQKLTAAYTGIENALVGAYRKKLDVPASTLIPPGLSFSGVPQTWMGPMDWGVDFRDLSSRDHWESAEADYSYMIKEGYGSLVARMGAGLPVRLNAPVTRINWDGMGVSIETPAGTIRAKACIVTVSPGVLASGTVKFTPDLPVWKQQAIANLPMGLLAKIALQFDGERFGLIPNNWLSYAVPNEMPAEACYFLTFPFGFDIMIGFVGGAFGWGLSRAGPEAAVDFALNEVVKMFGSNARAHFVKGHLTEWADYPWTRGAYAAATPGNYGAREDLARPIGDRVFFAGDTVAMPYVALCGGAFLSGQTVAHDVAAAIG